MADNLESLPPEIILEIMSFLDIRSLCQASQTCKKWFDFIYNSDLLWKKKYRSLDREEVEKDIQTSFCWRSIFIRNYGTNLVKKRWLEGKYSQVKSHDDVPGNHLGPLNTETWGSILDMEMQRIRKAG